MGSTALIGAGSQAVPQALLSESSTQLCDLGTFTRTNDGRGFVYAKAGATALVPGKLQQSSAEDTSNFQNLTVTAPSAGATSITTTSTTTLTVNQLAGGLLVVTTATLGLGQTLRIKGHAAASAAVVTINLDDAVVTTCTGTVKIDMAPNPLSAVVVNPTTLTSAPQGVAVYPVTAAYFGWLQVLGACGVLADGANAVGSDLVASNGVAGAVEDAASSGAQPLVGTALTGCADQEYGLVKLRLV